MDRSAADILDDALALPVEARAALASALIRSLDEDTDDDVEAAWSTEIARRIDEIDQGTTQLIPWSEVRRRLAGQ